MIWLKACLGIAVAASSGVAHAATQTINFDDLHGDAFIPIARIVDLPAKAY